ncbi:hypothetical protein SK571_13470 [Lentzea sp. BCCO 10_0798]|uniref:Uncharacterized protein n=1 Tax=Lentzea kristufekii TaxID=3095430 RepID=A0ABU4TQ44_9PSEU|nr:hypothetical protein [Lentzea sp. BCCO 10_0798]MDX8050395.1 hypothetical protein [Lentzea sp. BCCO 10_0798]
MTTPTPHGSRVPVRKVGAGGAAGAAATVVLWVLTDLVHLQVPAGVAAAISVLVTAGVAYLVPGKASTGEPPSEAEQLKARWLANHTGAGGPHAAETYEPLTDDERQAVRAAVEQLTRDATLTLRVKGSEVAQRELARDLSAFLERRRDQQSGGG